MKKLITKKRSLGLITSTIISTLLLTTTVFASSGTVDISSGALNVRTSPTTNSTVIATLKNGDTVDLVEEVNGFYKIDLDGKYRYVSKDYIDVNEAEGIVLNKNVVVRNSPTATADTLGTVERGYAYTVLSKTGDWYKIVYNDEVGYVPKTDLVVEFDEKLIEETINIITEETTDDEASDIIVEDDVNADADNSTPYALVLEDGVHLRKSPTQFSTLFSVLPKGTVVETLSTDNDDWIQVDYEGITGYIESDYLQLDYKKYPNSNSSAQGQEIADYSQQFLGTIYTSGGTDLINGVDCSGFTYAVYRDFGYTINRTSSSQYDNGIMVDKEDLQPGDLVFFDTTGINNGSISHVGIYIGDGQFTHTSTSRAEVIISSLDQEYYLNAYVGATRIIY